MLQKSLTKIKWYIKNYQGYIRIISTFMLGFWLSYFYFNHQKLRPHVISKQLNQIINKTPIYGLQAIMAALPGTSDAESKVSEALIVRLNDDMNYLGSTRVDSLTPEVTEGLLRGSIQTLVYPWTAAIASCVPIYKLQGRLYIAMEHNLRQDGSALILRAPEGYMSPKAGTRRFASKTYVNADLKDNAEEELLLRNSHSLTHARIDMISAYKRQKNMYSKAKNELLLNTIDQSLYDTAVRELREEIGLDIKKEDIQFVDINLGKVDSTTPLPVIKAQFMLYKRVSVLPKLKPDGIEVDKAFFLDIRKIDYQIFDGLPLYSYTMSNGDQYSIPNKYVFMIASALNKYRNASLERISAGRYPSTKNLLLHHDDIISKYTFIQQSNIRKLLGDSPESLMIKEGLVVDKKSELIKYATLHKRAQAYHEILERLARLYVQQSKNPSYFEVTKAICHSCQYALH